MSAIDKAVKIIGGQTKLATVLGTKQSVVHHWVSRHGQAPAKYIPRISELTNGEITVDDLLADHQKSKKEDAA